MELLNKPSIAIFSNVITFDQFSKRKPRNLSNVYLLLYLVLVIILIVQQYIYILKSNRSSLHMRIRPTIISSGLTCNLQISLLKLLMVRYMGHYAIFSKWFVNIALFIINIIGIIVPFCILKSMKAYYIFQHQFAICIFLYIYSFLLIILEFFGLFVK